MAKITECLLRLTQRNVDTKINKHVKFLLDNMDELQLEYKLSQPSGIKIDGYMINLWYYPNSGFRCMNLFQEKYGRLPLCNFIETFLNDQLRLF